MCVQAQTSFDNPRFPYSAWGGWFIQFHHVEGVIHRCIALQLICLCMGIFSHPSSCFCLISHAMLSSFLFSYMIQMEINCVYSLFFSWSSWLFRTEYNYMGRWGWWFWLELSSAVGLALLGGFFLASFFLLYLGYWPMFFWFLVSQELSGGCVKYRVTLSFLGILVKVKITFHGWFTS